MRLRSMGRGRNYSAARRVVESILSVAYAGDWPARLWANVPGACDVDVVRTTVAAPNLSAPVRIAFASDLHLGPTTPTRLLDRAFEHLADAKPDVLAFGGDYVFLDATPSKVRELAARVAAVPATTKVAVLGNHDLWTDHRALERALERAGVRVLINDAIRHEDLALLGVDDPWTGEMDAECAIEACGDATTIVAIAHAPEAIPRLAARAELIVCGHTHGGHLALPGGVPIVVPGPLGKTYPHGVHRVGRATVVVSRGIGGIELPIRTFAPPDVVVVDLVGAQPRAVVSGGV